MGYDKTIASGVASVFEAKRNARKSLIDSRREELYAKIPELKAIDDEISSVSFSLFKKVADGFDQEEAAKTIKSETDRLCAKRDDLIKEAGYPVSYLNPPYNCRKCKDEGFIGNSYCECFKKELLTKVFAESNLATLSKNKFSEYLASGVWDKVTIGNWDSNVKLADRKFEVIPNAYSVSQFFKVGSVSGEIRTSGYCKFADMEMGHTDENGNFIPLAKNDKINVTGILGIYDGDSQITIIDETGVEYL